ncbi:MAG: zinc-binding dehydrogenase [SAR202 cluster bacterium]|nr:zinc-binding dehydrogenase [SAR202 cluster bacterium]|tara:strand:- start:2174 stop:3220 length:1047 start_codon:yes stop_codon:yes gene_type:complete
MEEKLKAVYITEFGGIDKLVYGDMPDPQPESNEVIINVKASALNHLDLGVRSGRGRVPGNFPRILGCDMSGEIVGFGKEVSGFKTGDRVLVDNRVKCDKCRYCILGEDQFCSNQMRIGVDLDGGHAEFCVVPAVNVHKISDDIGFEEAAAMPLAFHTAWQCVVVKGDLKPWETILIQAGGSGVGSAAIQIAKRIGAKIITTASTDEKIDQAIRLGAHYGINYTTNPDFSNSVRDMNSGRLVDMILDVVGAAVWQQNLLSLKAGGRLVITGTTSGSSADIDLSLLSGRPLTLMGSGGRTRRSFVDMMEVINRGELHGVVGAVFSLDKVGEAHELMESRKFSGKIVITGS